jgi:endonuclease III
MSTNYKSPERAVNKTSRPAAFKETPPDITRICRFLDRAYGSPRHGNPRKPLDDLIYIILSTRTRNAIFARTFLALKKAFPNWNRLFPKHRHRLERILMPGGLGKLKAQQIIAIVLQLRRRFGSATLDPLGDMTDAEAELLLTSLPGVGPKIAKCVLMYTLNRRLLPVDVHVHRVPDATPELIRVYALDDEQALLAIVRYNRLIDTFLGLTTYSLQNHLRTTVKGIGQIEIDELYIGLDKQGCHYVIPVQAKGGKDQIGVVQTTQDIRFVEQKFPGMRCRAIAAQFMEGAVVALFELTLEGPEVKVIEERHYQLVPAKDLDPAAIRNYRG